jgi:hypothetical protein
MELAQRMGERTVSSDKLPPNPTPCPDTFATKQAQSLALNVGGGAGGTIGDFGACEHPGPLHGQGVIGTDLPVAPASV